MKKLIFASVLGLSSMLGASGTVLAAPVCIESHNIRNTDVRDDRTIDFHMIDGTVWRNRLQNTCPALKFNGFAYNTDQTDTICDNQQSIHVVQSGEVCLLGKFEKLAKAR